MAYYVSCCAVAYFVSLYTSDPYFSRDKTNTFFLEKKRDAEQEVFLKKKK